MRAKSRLEELNNIETSIGGWVSLLLIKEDGWKGYVVVLCNGSWEETNRLGGNWTTRLETREPSNFAVEITAHRHALPREDGEEGIPTEERGR